jgi:hypothetical protein
MDEKSGVTKVTRRSGTSFARGVAVEQYLRGEEEKILHSRWRSEWGLPLSFQGGIRSVTCEMLLGVPLVELVKTYGKKRAAMLREIASRHAKLT